MAAIEYRVLSEIVRSKTLSAALLCGLSPEYFLDHESKEIYEFINKHWHGANTRNQVPMLETIRKRWPGFQLTAQTEEGSIENLVEELRNLSSQAELMALSEEIRELLEYGESESVLKVLEKKVSEISRRFGGSKAFGIKEIVSGVQEAYQGALDGTIYGIPWPWDCLTADTMGKRKGDLIVFYGRAKSLKCVCEGSRILTYGKEGPSLLPIEDVPETTKVPSYTRDSHTNLKFRAAPAKRVVSGMKDCVEVKTASGLALRTSTEHLYMVPYSDTRDVSGSYYERICNLQVGDVVATAGNDWDNIDGYEGLQWEQIVSITPIGKVMCYDICITDGKDPNFVVEGFVVHNTWTMLKSAADDYLKYNQRVMIWSREMTPDKLQLRLGSLLAGVDYQRLKAGNLPAGLRKRAFETLKDLETKFTTEDDEASSGGDLIVLSGRHAPKTVGALEAMVEIHRPDILYIDSYYHLETPRASAKAQQWHTLQLLTEDLKSMAMDRDIPVVGVAQANRSGEKTLGADLTEVAGSDAIGREADLIMRVIKRRNREVFENHYEAEKAEDMEVTEAPKPKKLGLGKFGGGGPKKRSAIPQKALDVRSADHAPRIGAELAILLPGNREGVLEGFTIHAVPGYNFDVIENSLTAEDVKKWVNRDQGSKPKAEKDFPKITAASFKGM